MTTVFTPSLEAFVSHVFDNAVHDAVRSDGFEPFGALLYGDEPVMFRLGEPDSELPWEEQLSKLRAEVRSLSNDPEGEVPDAVAVAFDTFITVDGQRTDAVGVEAHEPGRESGVFVVQRYMPRSRWRKGREHGNALVLRDDVPPMT